jgi:cap2 methyltransferase
MLVFNITQNIIKLPNLNKWLNISDNEKYTYHYEELYEIKKKLNDAKHNLDKITNKKKYDSIVDLIRPQDELRGRSGILVTEYNAEIVTNAWLKMFELMIFVEIKNKKFTTFHVAEAPGNFLLAINHKINTENSDIEWEWLASSYRELFNKSENNYLIDQYHLIRKFQDNWIFGADGDGDITSPDNIVSFSQIIRTKFGHKVDLFTSDVKYVPVDVNFDEEERINLPVHLGHLLCALVTLNPGGVMILKEFTLLEASSVCMLYIMAYCFEKLHIVKPETSRPANSEIYIVGTGYKDNLTEQELQKLLNIMEYIRFMNTDCGSPAIFTKDSIPTKFIDEIVEVQSSLAAHQISGLEQNLALFEKYKNSSPATIRNDLISIRQKVAYEWIKKMKVKKLDDINKMLKRIN